MPVLKQYLEQRGMKAIEEERFKKFLCSEGVRFGGFVSAGLAEKARDELNVKYIMAGAIVLFSTEDNPKVGILARLIDSSTGIIVWSDYASITGEDFIKLLGMGKVRSINSLIPRAMDRLFASFSTEPPPRGVESTYTVAVMPFLNESEYSYAGKIATYMFLTELFHSSAFTPVEFGEIRKFVLDQRIKTRGGVGYSDMDALMARLNVGSVLVGTIEHYPTKKESNIPPRVVISARLIDATNKKILWYNSRELDGEDDIIAFDWGRLRTADRVAYKTIAGLVKNMESVK
jgi:TolB-like protein